MLAPVFAFPLIRAKLSAVAVLVAVVTPGHAVAKNHDVQTIRIPAAPLALHDRASGPVSRQPT